MSKNIKGITIEIDGKTTGLEKALSSVNKEANKTQQELNAINKGLKFNPGNAELAAQKQKLLSKQVEHTSDKLQQLKNAEEQVKKQVASGKLGEDKYRAFQREVIETESKLKHYKQQLDNVQKEQDEFGQNTKRLETYFKATKTSIDDYESVLGTKLVQAIKNGTASSKDLGTALDKISKEAVESKDDIEKLKIALDKIDDGESIDNIKRELDELSRTSDKTEEHLSNISRATASQAILKGAEVIGNISGEVVEFGQEAIESAAKVKALDAQLDQVFGEQYKSAALEEIEAMGQEFGILPNRLKASYSAAVSMFKGLGNSTDESMKLARDAITITADSAAFFDKSFDDANGALNSFIKGSYQGGESIGLFANETQISAYAIKKNLIEASEEQKKHAEQSSLAVEKAQAAYSKAVEKYGESSLQARDAQMKLNEALEKQENGPNLTTKWQKLTEAQKQSIRLQYAKEMQSQSGAMGIAAKEADGYENVMGNLASAQEAFMAAIGEETLNVFLDIIQSLIPLIQQAAQWFKGLNPEVKQFIAIVGIVIAVLGSLAPVILALSAASIALNISLLPLIGIIAGIIAAIAAVILIIQNWDSIVKALGDTWNWLSNLASTLWNGIGEFIGGFIDGAVEKFNELGKFLGELWDSISEDVGTVWEDIKTTVSNAINGAKEAVNNAIEAIKGFLNFEWKWPKIPLPHFTFSGSLNPLDWGDASKRPNVGVEWYAKGGILKKPTVFGMNGNNLMVGGEAGNEAVLPLNKETLGAIGQGIAATFDSNSGLLLEVVDLLQQLLDKDTDIYIDGDIATRKLSPQITTYNNIIAARNKRVRGVLA